MACLFLGALLIMFLYKSFCNSAKGESGVPLHLAVGRKAFEETWLKEDNVHQIVDTTWERSNPGTDFSSRKTTVHLELHAFGIL